MFYNEFELTGSCNELCWNSRHQCKNICAEDLGCEYLCEIDFADCASVCPCQASCPQSLEDC